MVRHGLRPHLDQVRDEPRGHGDEGRYVVGLDPVGDPSAQHASLTGVDDVLGVEAPPTCVVSIEGDPGFAVELSPAWTSVTVRPGSSSSDSLVQSRRRWRR